MAVTMTNSSKTPRSAWRNGETRAYNHAGLGDFARAEIAMGRGHESALQQQANHPELTSDDFDPDEIDLRTELAALYRFASQHGNAS